MSKILNRIRAFFSSEAKTVGLSPKVLAPFIASGIAALISWVGLTPGDISGFLHVNVSVITGGELILGTAIAAWLLGPGTVAVPDPELTAGSDARLSPEAQAKLAE